MHLFARMGLIGGLMGLAGCTAEGPPGGGSPDATPADAPPPIRACTSGTQGNVLSKTGTPIGQTQSHVVLLDGGLKRFAKPAGVEESLAPLEDGVYLHLVSEEMVLSRPYGSGAAQVTTFDGQHFMLAPPAGESFRAAVAAPGGATYVLTRGEAPDVTDSIYRVRASTRSLELVRALDKMIFELQAGDDALYWMESSGDAGDYAVIEAKLDPPSERVLLAAARRRALKLLEDKLYIVNGQDVVERRDRVTGDLEKTFRGAFVFNGLSIAVAQGRVFQGLPASTTPTGPYCNTPSLLELDEQGGKPVVAGALPVFGSGGVLYFMEISQGCCSSGVCHPGSSAFVCLRL